MLMKSTGKVNEYSSISYYSFMSYYYIKTGKSDQAAQCISESAGMLDSCTSSCTDMSFWLWSLGEYLKETGEINFSEKYFSMIDVIIDRLQKDWNKPSENWICNAGTEIFLSNISIIYGGLFSYNNVIRNERIQKLLIEIRKFVFERFIKDGRLVSRLGSSAIYGDITVAAVPFGLFGIEDRILVEAVESIDNKLIAKGVRFSEEDTYYGGCTRTDLSCLMAWYFSEKGEMGKAKGLLEHTAKVWNEDGRHYEIDKNSCREQLFYKYWLERSGEVPESRLAEVLYKLAELNIELKHGKGDSQDGSSINIIHRPIGYDDPYYFENNERCPRHPEAGDTVIIKVITQPFDVSQKVYIRYSVNGRVQPSIVMESEAAKNGERYWQGVLGCFNENDAVDYSITAVHDNIEAETCKFNFNVRTWQSAGRVIAQNVDTDRTCLVFESVGNTDIHPCLKLVKQNGRDVKWQLCFEKGVDASLYEPNIKPAFETETCILDIGIADGRSSIQLSDKLSGKCILKGYESLGKQFLELLTDKTGFVYKARFNFYSEAEERFFGMGERYSRLEYRGCEVDNYVYNQYRDQRLRTYIPVPFTISTKGYGLYLDTALYSLFRFASRLGDLFEIEVDLDKKQLLDFYTFTGGPKDILHEFTTITGRPEIPPKWSFGLWMSSNNWDSQEETLKQAELTEKYKIPATVLVLEQWSDEATFYIFNDAGYQLKSGDSCLEYKDFTFPEWGRWPDPLKMVEKLHEQGLKVLLWQVSVEKYMNGVAHAQRDEDESSMLEHEYYVKNADGSGYRIPYGWFNGSLIPDFTNPEAAKWWLDKRLYLLKDINIDGFKTDGGECVFGSGLIFHDGSNGDEMRNRYPLDYIGSFYDFVQKNHEGGGITFSRSGYTGAQKMPLHWAGDERSTWEAFRASVIAGLSCSMSGIPFWGWDLAGFHGDIPSAELYLRAVEMAVFCPVMQYHAETKGEFNQDRTPWNIAERTGKPYVLKVFKKYADLRMNLLPYIYQQALISGNTGIPLMRSMYVEYPADTACMGLEQQYMFGEGLLVAPVMEEGAYVKDVYLPEGRWLNFFTGDEVQGACFVAVKAGIDTIPVYLKENCIIPLNLADDFMLGGYVSNSVTSYENLCYMINITDKCNCNFADDLGNSVEIVAARDKDIITINAGINYATAVFILGGIHNAASVEAVAEGDFTVAGDLAAASGNKTLECNYIPVDTGLAIKVCNIPANNSIRLEIKVIH